MNYTIDDLKTRIHRYGRWAALRWMAKNGVPIEKAWLAVFARPPLIEQIAYTEH